MCALFCGVRVLLLGSRCDVCFIISFFLCIVLIFGFVSVVILLLKIFFDGCHFLSLFAYVRLFNCIVARADS